MAVRYLTLAARHPPMESALSALGALIVPALWFAAAALVMNLLDTALATDERGGGHV